ncbi:cytochrome c peroxidase [Yoonia sp. R2-816]|uniref:cytochrome c peroxidase n=1 Tax=Yoonia sp. R2-816 TaxID=3342638 RepID=UPI0037283266
MFYRVLALSSAVFATSLAAQDFPVISPLPPLEQANTGFDEEAMSDLGRLLFFDTRLSGDASTSCASCHDPAYGWGDGSDLARGYPGTMHWRNSQTLVNAAYMTGGMHWDGTVPSLTEQVPGAMGTSVVSNINAVLAEERLRQIPEYVAQFEQIWDAEPSIDTISQAIAAYERTLISDDSPFDRFARGEADALSLQAVRGLVVFQGKGNCLSCHNGPLATDMQFYNTSVPPNPGFTEEPLRQVTFRTMMRGFGIEKEVYESFDRDPGRFLATRNPADLGTMRTPPLRYLKYTAPYMHNGVFYTLEEVVDFYNDGGTPDVFGTKSTLIQPLGLTNEEKADLVAFLESLSGSEVTEDYPELPDYEIAQFPMTTGSGAYTFAQAPQSQVMTINLEADIQMISPGLTVAPTEPVTATPAAATVIIENGERLVIVKDGDTLGTLAEEIYGDVLQYQKIYAANRDRIPDPNALEVGIRLRLPE